MTAPIVAPPAPDVEAYADAPPALLPMPGPPGPVPVLAEPTPQQVAEAIAARTGAVDPQVPVPAGVEPGSREIEQVLDWLVPAVEAIRRKLAETPAPGFVVTAADTQRAHVLADLFAQAARVLAERA